MTGCLVNSPQLAQNHWRMPFPIVRAKISLLLSVELLGYLEIPILSDPQLHHPHLIFTGVYGRSVGHMRHGEREPMKLWKTLNEVFHNNHQLSTPAILKDRVNDSYPSNTWARARWDPVLLRNPPAPFSSCSELADLTKEVKSRTMASDELLVETIKESWRLPGNIHCQSITICLPYIMITLMG